MPTRKQTLAESKAWQKMRQAEGDYLDACVRLERARENFEAVVRAGLDERLRPRHLQLLTLGEPDRQSA